MDKITKNLQFVLLTIILISTIIAVGIEIKNMFMIKYNYYIEFDED